MDGIEWQREAAALRRANQELLERIAALEAASERPDRTAVVELDLVRNAVRLRRGRIDRWEHDRWADLFALLHAKSVAGPRQGLLYASEVHTVGH